MSGEQSVDRTGFKDLKRIFPLLRELFDYAEKMGFDSSSFDDYGSEEQRDNPRAIEFPENFNSLVEGHPGKYFIVAYNNRQNPYYKEGTRHRIIRLSSVPKRSQTDERVREVDLIEVDPSFGNKTQIKVRESVNNKSFANINTATGEEVEQPHGQAEYMYELDPQGIKTIRETRINRLDEGLFPWKGEEKPVRWVRNLHVEKDEQDIPTMAYEDLYIIGRMSEGGSGERAQVKTFITGSPDNPKSVLVEIGVDSPLSAKVVYEHKQRNIKVILYEGTNAYENQLQIVQQDPAYATLFRKPVDIEELMKDIAFKARMLQEDWDKPQAVFTRQPAIEAANKELES